MEIESFCIMELLRWFDDETITGREVVGGSPNGSGCFNRSFLEMPLTRFIMSGKLR
jgi:hypothetical protein